MRKLRWGGGEWSGDGAHSGLDWQIKGVCGRHVSKYCAIQFPADITRGCGFLSFFFFYSFFVPEPMERKNRKEGKLTVN